MWHFHKLTAEDQARILEYVKTNDWFKIVTIIIDREVPPAPLSPCCSLQIIKDWIHYGIHEKLISTERGEI